VDEEIARSAKLRNVSLRRRIWMKRHPERAPISFQLPQQVTEEARPIDLAR
jgi:hypothetical protein